MNINSSKKLRVSYHIEKTQKIRNRENELLLRTISPHHAVFTQSVSRCLVQVLILAGIYFDHYKPFNKCSISIQGLGSKRTDRGNTEKRMLVYKFYLSKNVTKKNDKMIVCNKLWTKSFAEKTPFYEMKWGITPGASRALQLLRILLVKLNQ